MSEPKLNQSFTDYMIVEDSLNPGKAKVNPTIAAGDFQVSGNGAAFANLTNLPTKLPASSEMVQIILTAAEMNFSRVVVRARDVAGGEWEEAFITLQTLASTLADVNAKTALLNFNSANEVKSAQQFPTGVIVADGGNTALTFKTDRTEGVNDFWINGSWIQFTSGSLLGQTRQITGYNGTTKFITVGATLTSVPSAADAFKILNE